MIKPLRTFFLACMIVVPVLARAQSAGQPQSPATTNQAPNVTPHSISNGILPPSGTPNAQGAQVPSHDQANPAQNEAASAGKAPILKPAESPKDQQARRQGEETRNGVGSPERSHGDNELTIANFTIALAFATFLLAIATFALAWYTRGVQKETKRLADEAVKQGEYTITQIGIAKENSEAALKSAQAAQAAASPVVGIRNYRSGQISDDNGIINEMYFRPNLINTGNSFAMDARIFSRIEITNSNLFEFDWKEAGEGQPITIEPHTSYSGQPAIISIADAARIWRNEVNCFFYTRINYRDTFGNAHHNERCVRIFINVNPTVEMKGNPDDMVVYMPAGNQNTSS